MGFFFGSFFPVVLTNRLCHKQQNTHTHTHTQNPTTTTAPRPTEHAPCITDTLHRTPRPPHTRNPQTKPKRRHPNTLQPRSEWVEECDAPPQTTDRRPLQRKRRSRGCERPNTDGTLQESLVYRLLDTGTG